MSLERTFWQNWRWEDGPRNGQVNGVSFNAESTETWEELQAAEDKAKGKQQPRRHRNNKRRAQKKLVAKAKTQQLKAELMHHQSSLLLMHVVSISSRCLHTSSPLSVSQSPSRAHSLTQLSETANSLPGLCISLTLFAHILNVVCTQSSSPLSAHQSPSTLPLAASRSQPVPLSLFPERFLPAS